MASLGSTPGIIVGVGVGAAASAALQPVIEPARQEAWAANPYKILDTNLLARLVAQGGIELGDPSQAAPTGAYAEAYRDGYSPDKLKALVYLAQTVPGFAESLQLLRRHPEAFAELWQHTLVKNGLDPRYHPYLTELQTDRLSPQVVALAIVRGIMADPGFLPVGPPSTAGKVKPFPVSPLPTLSEAAAGGFDRDRLFVQTAIMGRPMGPEAAAAAVFRGILEKVDYQRAVAEGDVRNEWAEAIFETARQIPTPITYVNQHLRGWTDRAGMYGGTARHGMSEADTDVLFQVQGRPPSSHQVLIGLLRGGVYDGPTDHIDPAFLKALKESDIRPEWYNLLWAGRHSYPAAFVLRALTEAGDLTAPEAEQILTFEAWPPELAHKVATRWGAAPAAKADPWVAKADSQLWSSLHKSYLEGHTSDSLAQADLTLIGVTAAGQQAVLARWQRERQLARRSLSVKQILKATAEPYATDTEKLAALHDLGFSEADAQTLLTEA